MTREAQPVRLSRVTSHASRRMAVDGKHIWWYGPSRSPRVVCVIGGIPVSGKNNTDIRSVDREVVALLDEDTSADVA